MGPDVVVLLNSHADRRDPIVKESVAAAFEAAGCDAVIQVTDGARIADCAQALKNGARVLVAGGGDGTVSSVAHALVGSDAAMGVGRAPRDRACGHSCGRELTGVRTLVHLSDLHFGRVDRGVVDALAETVNEIAPDDVRAHDIRKIGAVEFQFGGLFLLPAAALLAWVGSALEE